MELLEIENKLKSRLDFDGMAKLAFLIVDDKVKCEDIIKLCTHKDLQIAFRASWVLDFFIQVKIEMFLTHIPKFLTIYPKTVNRSVQRNFTKILMCLTTQKFIAKHPIKSDLMDECLAASFEWLLDAKTPVAVQSNALEVIFQLSPYHDWVLEELKIILQQKLVSGSPALMSRAKRILKNIN